MIFGVVIRPIMLVTGGTVLIVLMSLQILVGMRKIKFKGRLHQKVHKWGAWVLAALSVLHGFMGYVFAFQWRIG